MYNYKLRQVLKRKITDCGQDITCDGVLLSKERQRRRTFPHKECSNFHSGGRNFAFYPRGFVLHFHKLTLKYNSVIHSVRCSIFLC